MKIHRWSPWLRRNHTWAPIALATIDIAWNMAQIVLVCSAVGWLLIQLSKV